MGLIDQAKSDIEDITSNTDGFGVALFFEGPCGEFAEITGLHTKHHLGVDTEGNSVNSKNAHVSFSEKFLTDLNYPVRNLDGEVSMVGHKVRVKDSTGLDKTYVIEENYPDETIGLIVCILGNFE